MLTKKEFEMFRKETEEALKSIAEKYGATIKAGKIKYTNNSFNLDLQVVKKDIGGKSFEQVEFEKYCVFYGIRPEDYNREVTYNGKIYNLVGFKPNSSKYPILLKCEDGKTYKWGTDLIKLLLVG
ncbi:MAG: hypothetical protein PHT02_01155 [Tissierellia bacterium]|nr:hypothetical protein [Tissierellia bacterium]